MLNLRTVGLMLVLAAITANLTVVANALAAEEAYWNQYRGPVGDGHSAATGLPLKLDDNTSVTWKIAIDGKGWSSPVVWGNQIWLTTAPADGKQMFAICVDAKTGAVIHKVLVFENDDPQFCHPLNSYATPTPFVEAGRVYVHFGVHGTACLDTKSGEKVWERRDLPCNHFRGPASSPIVFENLLICQFDGFDVQYVVAMDKTSGKTVWKRDRAFDFKTDNGDNKKAYCTPTIYKHNGKLQLICPAAIATETFEPRSGKLLWTVYHGGMNASARPLYADGLVYITNGMGRMVAVKPDGTGDITKQIVWESGQLVPKKSSLLYVEGLMYMVSDNGVASCVEPKTGEVIWSSRLNGENAASPVYVDGRIYCFSMDGDVHVIAPGREFNLLSSSKFESGFMASPAIVGNAMILRTKTHLYRIEK
ncbi:MAG: outer membrane protein assembly factor BamB [Pirellulaceae bacterium]|jgi:outer membrane protein assembly factor BamB